MVTFYLTVAPVGPEPELSSRFWGGAAEGEEGGGKANKQGPGTISHLQAVQRGTEQRENVPGDHRRPR